MSSLTTIEKKRIESLFGMSTGYVLTFSNDSFAQVVREAVSVEIYESKYAMYGDSKAKRLRCFWDLESDSNVGKVLSAVLDVWKYENENNKADFIQQDYIECRRIAERLLNSYQKVIEEEILSEAFDGKTAKRIYIISADQIQGEWIRIGDKDFYKRSDPVYHLQYRAALDRLLAANCIELATGRLYQLTLSGIIRAREILSRKGQGTVPIMPNVGAIESASVVSSASISRDIPKQTRPFINFKNISWKHPVSKILATIVSGIIVGVVVFYLTEGKKAGDSSQTVFGDYTIGDSIAGNKISGQTVIVNNYSQISPKTDEIKKVRLIVNRGLDDYFNKIDAIRGSYAEDSKRMISDFASRGTYVSSGHISSHVKLAIKTKQDLDIEKLRLTRNIEDVLVETLAVTSLDAAGIKFNQEKQRFRDAQAKYNEMCAFLSESIKNKEMQILKSNTITKDFNIAAYKTTIEPPTDWNEVAKKTAIEIDK